MSAIPSLNIPPFRQQVQWLKNPFDYMDRHRQALGPIFETAIFGQRAVMVGNASALQAVLASPHFTAPGDLNAIARPLLGDNSLIVLNEPAHQQRRKLLMPPFHGDRLVSYAQTIGDITATEIAQWQTGQPFDVRASMQEITLRVILKTVFGIQDGDRLESLKHALVKRFDMTASGLGSTFIFLPFLRRDWGAWSPWGRIMAQQRYCDQLIYAEIGDRRAHPDPQRSDILNLLMAAVDENGQHLSDTELRDELMTLLFAGHETTATALSWALYLIHQHPTVYQTLMAELQTLAPDADPMAVVKLPYLSAVCNETLRLYPVGMLAFSRQAQTDTAINGYAIPAHTVVIGSLYLTHRDPAVYPEPTQFRPERFLQQQFSPYEFIPFGAGSRRCIGAAMAQMEMKLVLTQILTQYQLQHHSPDAPLQPVRRGALLGMASDFQMQAIAPINSLN